MHIAFVNPQGNFDPAGSYLGAHPDFGGQLVYVREVALALASMGHQVDILTRRIVDPLWPEFAASRESYPECRGVRVLRFPCGPPHFLPKEELWPYLPEWVQRIARWYRKAGAAPDAWTGHYGDGGLCAALLQERTGVPYTFTAHSLGAWKLDRLLHPMSDGAGDSSSAAETLQALEVRYRFGARITAERAAMARAAVIITSTSQERYEQYRHPVYRGAVDVTNDRRFAVVTPGINLEVFGPDRSGPREHEIRQIIAERLARDIPPERRGLPAVIAWSRLDPKKNYLGLVMAFARSAELRARANLILITRGFDDPLRQPSAGSFADWEVLHPVVAAVEHADLWGTVSAFSLAGQDALAALFRWGVETRSVFCLPAVYEPLGLSVIEAMATGLPVVTTKNGGTREIMEGDRFGLLADPYDYEEVASQLLRLIADPEAWDTYARRGRERAVERYSWRHAAEVYAALSKEIARGKRVGDRSFPLPDFVRPKDGTPGSQIYGAGSGEIVTTGVSDLSVELPRLEGWEVRAAH